MPITLHKSDDGIFSGSPQRWTGPGAYLLIALAAILPHVGEVRTFLFFDSLLLRDEPNVRDAPAAIRQLGRTWHMPGQDLAMVTFALNRSANLALGLPEFDVAGFVLVNIALHAAAACLVFSLAQRLLVRAGWPIETVRTMALLSAAVFAVHPLHSSSVAYVVQRRGMMCSVFYLMALSAWLAKGQARGAVRRSAWLLLVFASAWASIKSKSMGVTLPLALLAMEYGLRADDPAARARLLHRCAGALLVWLAAILGFLYSQDMLNPQSFRSESATYESVNWGPLENALSQARVIGCYQRLLLLPTPGAMSIDHEFAPTRSWHDSRSAAALLLHVIILFIALRAARRGWAAFSFGVLLFYIAQLPWLFIPQPVLMAEYKTYLSAAGAALALSEVLLRAAACLTKRVVVIIGWVASLLLAGLTIQRQQSFRDPIALWEDVVAKAPNRFRGRFNLGNALYKEGRYIEAIEQYRSAAGLDPPEFRPHYNLANALMRLGRRDEAIQEYLETLRRHPKHEGARAALLREGIIAAPGGR